MDPSDFTRQRENHAQQVTFEAADQDHLRARCMSGGELGIISRQYVHWFGKPVEKPKIVRSGSRKYQKLDGCHPKKEDSTALMERARSFSGSYVSPRGSNRPELPHLRIAQFGIPGKLAVPRYPAMSHFR